MAPGLSKHDIEFTPLLNEKENKMIKGLPICECVFAELSVHPCVANMILCLQAEPCASHRTLMQKREKSNLNLLETETLI